MKPFANQATLMRLRLGAVSVISALLFTACIQEGQKNQGADPNSDASARTGGGSTATVSIDSPLNNAVVSGTLSLTATATGYANGAKVQYQLDDTDFGSAQTQPPYSVTWNTTESTSRSYRLTAIATDLAGNNRHTATITFTVDNTTYDTQAPTSPAQVTASAVSATQINLAWVAATDNVGVTKYTVYRNGTPIATTTVTSYADTSVTPSSQYSYAVSAADAMGNESPQSDPPVLATTPSADPTPPTVSFSYPTNNSTISNTVILTATASDNIGVVGVQYKLNGTNLGAEVANSPFSLAWNTNTKTIVNGSYTLTAVARDAAGNTATATITVTVNNLVVDNQAPTTPTNLTASAVSASQINLAWNASTDNVAVTGYKVYRTGTGTPIATTTTTSYANTGLAASSQYSYTVTAIDAAGNESLSSTAASASTPSSTILALWVCNLKWTVPTSASKTPPRPIALLGIPAASRFPRTRSRQWRAMPPETIPQRRLRLP
ncbi:MAG: fibronectin type III domain-containing protein [Gammaproteobacteria bacterium]|nr:fibronectin type III domain-containing protein [Gammaproteobacteria bacterium]